VASAHSVRVHVLQARMHTHLREQSHPAGTQARTCVCIYVLQALLNEYKALGSQREAAAQTACAKLEAELKRMQVRIVCVRLWVGG